MTPNFAEQAAQFIMSDEFNGKGPCLIPKPGREVPSCHENDFCECDMNKAFLAGCEHGYRVGKQACDCHGDETGRTSYKCVFHSEIDQLKARLAEVTEALEQREGVNAKSLLSQNLDLRARFERCLELLRVGIYEDTEDSFLTAAVRFLEENSVHPPYIAKGDL